MEDGFFTLIAVPIVALFVYGLSRLFHFTPDKRSRSRICAFASDCVIGSFFLFGTFVHAAQVRTIITGTFTQGYDWSGTFFAPGTNLTGKSYTLVFEMDDTKGVPYYGTWPNCNNGLQNSGFNTPVPHAVLTIYGSPKSYIFGALTANSVSSYVYSFNATSPKTKLYHRIAQSFSGASNLLGSESAQVEINLNSINKCRSWESGFSYALVPGKDTVSAVIGVGLTNASTFASVQNFGGYMNVAAVSVSGPIEPPRTPHIFFFDVSKETTFDVTNSTVPVVVVVGQPIYLFAIPGGTQPTAWKIAGNPIGNYLGSSYLPPSPTPTPTPTPTPAPDCAGPGCTTPVTTPPDFAGDSTQFYWTTPGSYTVQYNFVSGSAKATFLVLGPTNVDVNAKASNVAIIANLPNCPGKLPSTLKCVVWGTETKEFTGQQPFTPGISFPAQAVAPSPSGKPTPGEFLWEQLITFETITIDGKASPGLTGLDNAVFYPYTASLDPTSQVNTNNFAYDAPGRSLGSSTTLSRSLTGEMFLMWKPSMPASIPVTLGYVEWHTFFGADLVSGNTYSTFAQGVAYPFVKTTNYPTWTSVVGCDH